jgi:hypothetical protein
MQLINICFLIYSLKSVNDLVNFYSFIPILVTPSLKALEEKQEQRELQQIFFMLESKIFNRV